MITYKNTEYDSKAAVVRAMFLAGDMDNSPDQKKRVAALLGMTVQTVHATLVKMNGKTNPTIPNVIANVGPNMNIVGDDIRQAIENQYDECYKIAAAKGLVLPKIDILYNLKGTVAGQFVWRFGKQFFRANLELAKNNKEDYLKQTVPHEFCHYITFVQYRSKGHFIKHHGWEWKKAMISFFNLEPKRCHEYDTSQVKQGRSHYVFKCNCREWLLGHRRYLNFMADSRRYHCPDCKSHLTYVKYS
jgi:SprT protein